eukprot:scaffold285505_cov31-Tisochrysis_lutea.AAC.5
MFRLGDGWGSCARALSGAFARLAEEGRGEDTEPSPQKHRSHSDGGGKRSDDVRLYFGHVRNHRCVK